MEDARCEGTGMDKQGMGDHQYEMQLRPALEKFEDVFLCNVLFQIRAWYYSSKGAEEC